MSRLSKSLTSARRRPRSHTADELIDILAVCSGNICRTPYIAARLRACLPELRISSAGTAALEGAPPVDHVTHALARHGINDYPDVGRSLTHGLIDNTRLIITAARIHRVEVVAMDTQAVGKTFTLKELARVARQNGSIHGLDELVAHAADVAQAPEQVDYDDDLDDPYGQEWPAYAKMAAEVDAALAVLVPALREGVPA